MSLSSSPVAIEPSSPQALAGHFLTVKLAGDGPPQPTWDKKPTLKSFEKAIQIGRHHLPMAYEKAFIQPLEKQLDRVLKHTLAQAACQNDTGFEPAESIFGALYSRADGSEVAEQIRRFETVIAGLFNSFLHAEKRRRLNLPLTECLAPLPTFKQRSSGPFTLPVDFLEETIGASVSIVSLPSAYRNDPLLWTSLAHETGGHDVTHATPGLLDELRTVIRDWFRNASARFRASGTPALADNADQLGEVWAAWVDEASADVCGVLNLGPTFGLTFAAWLSALRAVISKQDKPCLLTLSTSPPTEALDPHPVDWLRPWLALGATQSLLNLSQARRQAYADSITKFMTPDGQPPKFIGIAGKLTVPGHGETSIELKLPPQLAAQIATQIGRLIATTPLRSLGGLSLGQIETWDETDEATALGIADGMTSGHAVYGQRDATHLLAGASIAVLKSPADYQTITDVLNTELSRLGDERHAKIVFDPHRPISAPKYDTSYVPVTKQFG